MTHASSLHRDAPSAPPGPRRRDLLKGVGSLGLAALAAPAPSWPALAASAAPGLVLPLSCGPYQNNGASPWSAELPVGSAGQSLKVSLDSGANFIWMTSSLCADGGNLCQHYGGTQFQYQLSKSFRWVSQTAKPVDFGPWGTMTVKTGQDGIGMPGGRTVPATFYLAENYTGSQFGQIDWDGGIGLPSGSAYVDPSVSFFVADLMDAGIIDPAYPYIAFDTDPRTRIGTCRIGGVDPARFDGAAGIRMPWQPYTTYPGVEYIWTCKLDDYSVGGQSIARDKVFCLDSGSSEFKGDDTIMKATLELVRRMPVKPTVSLTLGTSTAGTPGRVTVPPAIYDVLIEAGPDMGRVAPQFTPLGLQDLVLVGSMMMDHFYTIYEYDVTLRQGRHVLAPVAMYLFDKPGRTYVAERGGAWTVGRPKPVAKESP
ncbi:pepsin-like aspartic protease [Azospirillum sp. A39]|uniref:pepsin-like aspartic protease n=1 Tax=Azospirillum sp. A39 TaxID=3462279 RepID=UPI004045A0F3